MSATQVSTGTMRAVNYQGAFKVKVEDVPMPVIEHPDDVIVKVTTAGESLRCSPRYRCLWALKLQYDDYTHYD